MNDLSLNQVASATVKRTPVTCSACGELRIQFARCENCGNETPFKEEQNAQISESIAKATT